MLRGFNCFVTGGTSGLGKAAVKHITENQGKVVYVGTRTQGPEELRRDNAEYVKCDITSEDDVKNAINFAIKKFGPLNMVLNSAGIFLGSRMYDRKKQAPHSLDVFNKVMSINALGTFNVNRLATAAMAKDTPMVNGHRGVLINVSSIAGFEAQVGQIAYAASKGAIHSMTLATARDNSDLGIRCVTIAPGVIRTPMSEAVPDVVRKRLETNIPTPPRFGNPEEFGALVEHITLNEYINGEIIRLDGGLRMQGTS